ncbi:uncharacterized protein TNCV_1623271 [Trichonephila clavipes]|nr:uncharacterized protein TNCV_1623271 [Trichonephila clavipes]
MTSWTLYMQERDLIEHLPYCPGMAPSYYYLFLNLQLYLDETIFNLNYEVMNEVDEFLDSHMPQLFPERIAKLQKHRQTFVDLNGDHYLHSLS